MAEDAEKLTARPLELVPVAIAAFEEEWRSRGFPLDRLSRIVTFAREETELRLSIAPERAATDALKLAWAVASPIFERLMEQHEYLKDTIASMLAEAAERVTHISAEGRDE